MALKFMLLTLALVGAARAEYDYNSNTNTNSNTNNNSNNNISNNNLKASGTSNELGSLEQQDSNSSEEYRNNYQTPHNDAHNSEATPKGYDYSGQLTDSDASDAIQEVTNNAAASSASSALFPVPLPLLREQRQPEIFAPAHYSYNYAVNDENTGDIKHHSETRDGYVVHGSYSLIDPDGYKRIVTYTADRDHGFNAVVNRVPYVLKKLAAVPAAVLLDERSPGNLATPGASAAASAAAAAAAASAAASVKNVNENSPSSAAGDSYVSAARDRDTTNGIYA